MRGHLRGPVFFFLVLLVLVACQSRAGGGPSVAPTSSASARPSPSEPPASPSPEPTPSASPIPPEPSPSLASATPGARPTPVAVTGADDIHDTWWVFDAEAGGPNHITFSDEGTYRVGHGPFPGITIVTGTYSVEGDVLTFDNGWFDCPADAAGSYQLSILSDAFLKFLVVDDACGERASDFRMWASWQRGRPPVS